MAPSRISAAWMPNRILRDGILTSDRVNQLDSNSEVFYRRLMSVIDDYGRYDARVPILRAALFPLRLDRVREADVQRWMAECQKAGLVALYEADGKQCLRLLDFRQDIRAKKSKWPDPPVNASACDQVRASALVSVDEDVGVYADCEQDCDPANGHESYFGMFWESYPKRHGRKVGKKSALKAFLKIPTEQLNEVMRATLAYSKSCGEFPKDAVRFLKDDYWRDWLEPATSPLANKVATDEDLANYDPHG